METKLDTVKIAPLNPANPADWLRSVWLLLSRRGKLKQYKDTLDDATLLSLEQTLSWAASSFFYLPLALLVTWIGTQPYLRTYLSNAPASRYGDEYKEVRWLGDNWWLIVGVILLGWVAAGLLEPLLLRASRGVRLLVVFVQYIVIAGSTWFYIGPYLIALRLDDQLVALLLITLLVGLAGLGRALDYAMAANRTGDTSRSNYANNVRGMALTGLGFGLSFGSTFRTYYMIPIPLNSDNIL